MIDSNIDMRYEIRKIDDVKQLVFGWASIIVNKDGTEVVDHQGHIIEPLELEEAVYMFVRCGGMAAVMHDEYYQGSIVESIVFTPDKIAALGIPDGVLPIGWWVGVYVYDKEVFEDIKSGKYKMFSIAGRGTLQEVE